MAVGYHQIPPGGVRVCQLRFLAPWRNARHVQVEDGDARAISAARRIARMPNHARAPTTMTLRMRTQSTAAIESTLNLCWLSPGRATAFGGDTRTRCRLLLPLAAGFWPLAGADLARRESSCGAD